MLPNAGDDHFLGEATLLESLDANQSLTKRRTQTLVKQKKRGGGIKPNKAGGKQAYPGNIKKG